MLTPASEVELLIPQRPPVLMVDGLAEHTADFSVSTFTIHADNIFLEEGLLQLPGLVENIAQTCALRSGYDFKSKMTGGGALSKPPVGFIGEVKNLVIYELPKVGEMLTTRVDLLHTVFTASIVKGAVFCNEKLLAECEMKIFIAPEA